MSETIALIEASMRADADALRVIGQNIANADVTAWRRQIPVNTADFGQMVDAVSAGADNAMRPPRSEVAIDHRPGTLKTTGQPLDVAIEGDGFLVLHTSAGSLFTRRGDLHISADGVLTAASGDAVLGDNGAIHLGTATPVIDAGGAVRVAGALVDQLQIAHFGQPAQLQPIGNGLYANPQGIALADGYSIVRQGFLETSNVAPVGEMVQMMETLRHFEAAQRLARGYDQMLEKAISELGKVD